MTVRNRMHCRVEAKFAMFLGIWVEAQPEPRGEVLSGECGFRLGGPGTSAIGIDVALVTAEMKASIPAGQSIYDGRRLLAVEILSPYDTQKAIAEMIDLYLESGVILWIAHPDLRAISVHCIARSPAYSTRPRIWSATPTSPASAYPSPDSSRDRRGPERIVIRAESGGKIRIFCGCGHPCFGARGVDGTPLTGGLPTRSRVGLRRAIGDRTGPRIRVASHAAGNQEIDAPLLRGLADRFQVARIAPLRLPGASSPDAPPASAPLMSEPDPPKMRRAGEETLPPVDRAIA